MHNRAQLQCDGTCAEDKFHVWEGQTSPYSLTAGMRGRQFSSLLTASFCIGVARNRLTQSAALFSLTFPPGRFVPSHSNQAPPYLFNLSAIPI
jgi:hypothetical protein